MGWREEPTTWRCDEYVYISIYTYFIQNNTFLNYLKQIGSGAQVLEDWKI